MDTDNPTRLYRLDKRRARRAFEHAAATYDGAALLQREVGDRLVERLDYIRLAPRDIADIGSGTGHITRQLQDRYPRANLLCLDFAHAMLRRARGRQPWLKRLFGRQRHVCGDIEQLPLRDASVDLAVSGLTLQWCDDLDLAFRELRRVLRPGGLLMFTTFGPDTLKELRASWQAADGFTHVNAFTDMHDIGDALLRCGFADPVMDMETLTVTYPHVRALMDDLKAIGARNFTAGRPRGLTGRERLRKMTAAYEALRENGVLPATYEVVYGHCWKAAEDGPARGDGAVTVPLSALKRPGGARE
ncbi:MAG TPA: malonyl-[acyl-carrier protein] O-methyltransferase BioC [Gammaproteobacteria bacterium]|nr:malonyl-[acyl-carrier protein] O-methyltransferase BioC [Gammaproteobacteria bacterium]